MDFEKRWELVKRNTDEIITEEELKKLMKKKKKPVIYIGYAITGKPHIGYYVPIIKLADCIKAGFIVKFLLADLHGALDNCPWDVLEKRYQYYEKTISLMFKSVGIDLKDVEFVRGSSFQLGKKYFLDLLKLSTFTSIHECKRAAAEVVKFGNNPKLSGVIYPLMQALDEEYLGVDIQHGGTDQRKVLMFARENLPKIGYKRRIEFLTPLIPGLIGKKMSASDEKSKVDVLDDCSTIKKKLRNALCEAGNPDNGILAFLKYVLMVLKKDKKEKFIIKRDKQYGGDISYSNYAEIEKDFINKKLHPLDLKNAVADEINKLLIPFEKHRKKLKKLGSEAYA